MTSYEGRHAELYDIFYKDKPYKDEASFVHLCMKKFGTGRMQKILELACGTGTHALEFEKLGYEIVAVDYSPDMVARAKKKATSFSSKVDFRVLDMRDLALSDGPFDAAVCLFDSIGYVRTNDALGRVFRSIHRSLRRDGLFIFEFWHAPAMLRYYEPVRVRRWPTSDGELLRISETSVRHAEQISEVAYSVFELRNDGTYSSFKETQYNRFFLIQEMAAWLEGSNFIPLKFFAGFKPEENISDQTWHVVTVAQKKEMA